MILKVFYQGKFVGVLSDADGNIAFQYDKNGLNQDFQFLQKNFRSITEFFHFLNLKIKMRS